MFDRKQREKLFHNKVFSEHPRKGLSKFYKLQGAREAFFKNLIENDCRGKRVLEYGCGPGGYSFSLAKSGAWVVGIDISEVAIEQAKEIARKEDVEGTTEFLVMDAENLEVGDAISFYTYLPTNQVDGEGDTIYLRSVVTHY